MAMISGNTTNHRTRPDVESGIKHYAKKLGLTNQLPDLSLLNWNELRGLETFLWGKDHTENPEDYLF